MHGLGRLGARQRCHVGDGHGAAATPRHATPCHATPCHATPCHANAIPMPYHAVPVYSVPCHAMPHHPMFSNGVQCYSCGMACSRPLFPAMPCHAIAEHDHAETRQHATLCPAMPAVLTRMMYLPTVTQATKNSTEGQPALEAEWSLPC